MILHFCSFRTVVIQKDQGAGTALDSDIQGIASRVIGTVSLDVNFILGPIKLNQHFLKDCLWL